MNHPLPVVLGAVINNNNILLIRKNKSLFTDLWGLPSGKITRGEHIDQTIFKKIGEKAGLDVKYDGLLGVVSETISESDTLLDHFLMFLCRLTTKELGYKDSAEGKFRWFDLKDIENYKSIMIPSDFEMIKRVVLGGESGNYISLVDKSNNIYVLKKFEKV